MMMLAGFTSLLGNEREESTLEINSNPPLNMQKRKPQVGSLKSMINFKQNSK
jgi:hypothetical protein